MFKGVIRALRFGKGWKTAAPRVREEEIEIQRSDGPVPATLLRPLGATGPLPGWVALHGITRPGRRHPTLVRFVRALSASGATVLVPEVPEWKEMLLAPREAADTLRSAVLALAEDQDTQPGRLGVMGFSFGAPQALIAGMDPVLAPHLKAVASFGGYCDLERTVRFLFTGEHDWDGIDHLAEPDPYGRWIVGGNYLSRAEGYEDSGAVERALLELATEAGELQVPSWDPVHDEMKSVLADSLPGRHRALFRAFAPEHGSPVPRSVAEELIGPLARAARLDSPLNDFTPRLGEVKVPVRLIHGRKDRLIPFTETLRLAAEFPPHSDVRVFLTGMFSHSQRDGKQPAVPALREQLRFLRLMSAVLGEL